MRVAMNATINIAPEKLKAVRELFECETNDELADALREEALRYLIDYVNSNVNGLPAPLTATIKYGSFEVSLP